MAIALQADSINNTGFVLSNGLLTIDADHLSNQKRNAWYYEERDVKGGTLIIKGDTVQPGGFMQAARWDLNAQGIYSRSGEFIVAGSNAAETQALTSAFEAQIRAELGDAFTYEVAEDRLKTKFKADDNGLGVISAVAAIALAVVAGPAAGTLIGALGSSSLTQIALGTLFPLYGLHRAASGDTAMQGIMMAVATFALSAALSPLVSGVISNSVGSTFVTTTLANAGAQAIATGRIDGEAALKAGATSAITQGILDADLIDGKSINDLGRIANTPSGNVSETFGFANPTDRLIASGARAVVNAGVSSAINGGSFIDALKSSFINDMSAYASNDIGSAFIGKEGSLGHMLTHGVLGAMSEAARGGDPTAGAIGGITAAALAQPLDDALGLQGDARNIALTAITMLAGGYAAEALGHDGTAAAGVAQNATVNNYLKHDEQRRFAEALNDCDADVQCKQAVFDRFQIISDANNEALIAARAICLETGECAGFRDLINEGVAFGSRYTTPNFDDPLNPWSADQLNVEAMAGNDAIAAGLIERPLDQEVVLTPAQGPGPESDLPTPERYASAITVANTETVVEVSLTGASLALPDPSDLAVGAILMTKTGQTVGRVAEMAGEKFVEIKGKLLGFDDPGLVEAARLENRINADSDVFAGTGQNTKGDTSPAFKGNTDLDAHLVTGGPHKGSVYGAHNDEAFLQAVQDKGWTLLPDQRREIGPGIYENKYMTKPGQKSPATKTTYDPTMWSDDQMQSMSRQAVVKVESEANRGIRTLPEGGEKAQTYVNGIPFVVTKSSGKYYAFPGLVETKP